MTDARADRHQYEGTTTRWDPEMLATLRERARREERSVAAVVRRAVRAYLARPIEETM